MFSLHAFMYLLIFLITSTFFITSILSMELEFLLSGHDSQNCGPLHTVLSNYKTETDLSFIGIM